MNTDYFELSVWLGDAKRDLERDYERLKERIEKIVYYQKALDATDELLSKIDSLQEELESQKKEIDSLRGQLQEKEVQLSEQRKLSAGMAKKSSEEDLLKAFRMYANRSKRKTPDKRAFAKSAMLEIANANGLLLPEELAATIDSLDDEQSEPAQQVFIETLNGTATGQVTQNIGQSEQARLPVMP